MTRKLGTCVRVGLVAGDFPLRVFAVVANCIMICGSFVGIRENMTGKLKIADEAKVRAAGSWRRWTIDMFSTG